ncbi:hypothetical protein D039_0847A, partial [Vibrio parahaemolyticus EKP-028]
MRFSKPQAYGGCWSSDALRQSLNALTSLCKTHSLAYQQQTLNAHSPQR